MARPDRSTGLAPEDIIARIEKALAIDGTHTWADLRERLLSGQAQVFWNDHGVWIVEVIQTPQKRYLNAWVVAGELPGVMDLQPQVIAFAKEMGCERVVARARFGWKHVARAHGWQEEAMVISHEVS